MRFYTNVQQYGNKILYRGYNNGIAERATIDFNPILYQVNDNGPMKSLFGENVIPKTFDTIKDVRAYEETYKGIANNSSHDLHGMKNYAFQYIQREFPDVDMKFDISLINIFSYDIEVVSQDGFPEPSEAKHPISAIAGYSSKHDKCYVWGIKEFDKTKVKDFDHSKIEYFLCANEIELLKSFITWWSYNDNTPDVITGWNTRTFDTPYVINRIKRVLSDSWAKKLSPFNVLRERTLKSPGREQQTYNIYGIEELDWLQLFIKFGYTFGPQESYKLDHIAHVILGDNKLSYDEYHGLNDMFEKDYQKYIEYNIKDTLLVKRMEDKVGLVKLAITIAYKGGVNYLDALGTTAIWDCIIYRELAQDNITIPPMKVLDAGQYIGAYVKPPNIGAHDYVMSFDYNSLYPNIEVEWNISPETFVEPDYENPHEMLIDEGIIDWDKFNKRKIDKKYSLCANGIRFSKEKQGIIPKLVIKFYAERKETKKQMLDVQKEIELIKHELSIRENS